MNANTINLHDTQTAFSECSDAWSLYVPRGPGFRLRSLRWPRLPIFPEAIAVVKAQARAQHAERTAGKEGDANRQTDDGFVV